MPIVVPPAIPALGIAPSTLDPVNFDARMDALLAQLPGNVTAQNTANAATYANALESQAQAVIATAQAATATSQATLAAATANFKGAWSGLSGVLNMPASVYHNAQYWALLSNQANVAAAVPGVSVAWAPLVTVSPVFQYLQGVI